MLWILFILLFPAWLFAAEIEPVPIDTGGKDVEILAGKSTTQDVAVVPGHNRTELTFTRDAFIDPTQVLIVDVWSLIGGNWVRVCASTFQAIQAKTPARLWCNLRGGTETKADFTLNKASVDTKVDLVTKQAAEVAFIAPIHHSVAFDNVDSVGATGGTTLTLASFVAAATNPLIMVGVGEDSLQSTTGVTFNSVAMTQIGADQTQDVSTTLGIYQLTANSGTHDIVASFSSTMDDIALAAISFTGVHQATPVGTREESISFDGAPISITVPTNGMAVDFVMAGNSSNGCADALTPTGSNTEREDFCQNDDIHIAISTRDTTGSFPWDSVPGAYAFQLGVPINEAVAATTTTVTRRRF